MYVGVGAPVAVHGNTTVLPLNTSWSFNESPWVSTGGMTRERGGERERERERERELINGTWIGFYIIRYH